MPSVNPYDAVPDIDFAPESTEEIQERMIQTYEDALEAETGQRQTLPLASRERIMLNTMAYLVSGLYQLFGNRAKMNLPKYSVEKWLEVLASLWGLTRRPAAPAVGVVEFDLDMTYYINRSDTNRELEIRAAVEAAVQQYLSWQESTIGRDLNPDKLVALVIAAGAKRLEVHQPVKQVIAAGQIFKHSRAQVQYGGIEDD